MPPYKMLEWDSLNTYTHTHIVIRKKEEIVDAKILPTEILQLHSFLRVYNIPIHFK